MTPLATTADPELLLSLARQAQAAWGAVGEPVLLSHRENAVFRIRCAKGPAALRLHRPGYVSAAAIRSELWLMQVLAEAGLAVPRPIKTRDGEQIVHLADRLATVVSWIDGQALSDLVGTAGTGADAQALYHALGGLLARLHLAADAQPVPAWFTRHRWNRDGLVGDAPNWGRFWEHPILTPDQAALLVGARDAAQRRLAALESSGTDVGVIHADALMENVLVGNGVAGARGGTNRPALVLIDFDDCGPGFRMYELAVALSQHFGRPGHDALREAMLEGYAAFRALPAGWQEDWPLFAFLRAAASLGWTRDRLPAGSAATLSYRDRALTAARALLA